MTEHNVTIRLENKDEYRDVENLTREAFWNVYRPGCTEHYYCIVTETTRLLYRSWIL